LFKGGRKSQTTLKSEYAFSGGGVKFWGRGDSSDTATGISSTLTSVLLNLYDDDYVQYILKICWV